MVFNYTWDEVGRLASAERTDNGVEVVSDTFTYDASGQQVTKGQETFGLFGETSYRVDVFDSLALQNALFPDANGDYERRTATERLYLNAGGALLGHVFFDTGNLPEASNGSKIHVFMPFGDPLGRRRLSSTTTRASWSSERLTRAMARRRATTVRRDGATSATMCATPATRTTRRSRWSTSGLAFTRRSSGAS